MKRTSPVVHQPPKPAKVPHYSNDNIGQNIVSGNNINEVHFLPSQFAQQSQAPPNNMQNFQASSSEPPLMSPEISSCPASTGPNSKNDEGMFN